MPLEHGDTKDTIQAGMVANKQATDAVGAGGVYTVQCVGADGQIKWTDTFHNLVVNEGLQDMNTKYFTGSSYTATPYIGLIEGAGASNVFAAGDSLASHGGWTESTAYSGSRKAMVFGSATDANPSVITTSGAPSSFTMNATKTISGAFVCTVSSGTSGVLFSEGNFTGGDKYVDSGDTLNVTYTFALTAS